MVIHDPESIKPFQCSECGSRDIVNPVNNRKIDLLCQNCGHTQEHVPAPHERVNSSGTNVWTPEVNKKPYRRF